MHQESIFDRSSPRPARSLARGIGVVTRASLLLGLLLLGVGCSAPLPTPATFALEPGEYESCFDSVLTLARDQGMPAVLRDRAGGVVETAPRISGSIFEPWRMDNASLAEGIGNTVSLQRRRARFEFVPADFNPPSAGDPDRLDGPPLPGSRADDILDISRYEGPIEVRIWVYVERAFTPGVRSGTWTRSQTTFARDPLAPVATGEEELVADFSKWTPIRRDTVYEHRLLEALSRRLASASTVPGS